MADQAGMLVGQQLGNYRVIRLLGEGGFANVYLGEHIHLHTQVAIKALRMRLGKNDTEEFLSEARTIARLEHPHIVRVLDFGVEDTMPFLVMSYAPNGTLRQLYPRGVQSSPTTILPHVQQVASALQYAHNERLIHRDVKPENLLLGKQNEVLLGDFGIALIAQSSRYQSTKEVIGTAAYMAPEQLQGKPCPASDQYSLGIIVYEWLSGTRPFQGSFMEIFSQHLAVPPPSLRSLVPALSSDVEQVVLTALAKDPQQRFNSIEAFANALTQACEPTRLIAGNMAPPASPPPQPATLPNSANQSLYAAPTDAFNTPVKPPRPGLPTKKLALLGGALTIILILLLTISPFLSPVLQNFGNTGRQTPGTHTGSGTTAPGATRTATSATTPVSDGTTPGATPAITTTSILTSSTPPPVQGTVLYQANWSRDLAGWIGSSQWKQVNNGTLGSDGTSQGGATDSYIIWAPAQLTTPNYAVEAQIQYVRSTDTYSVAEFGIVVRGDGNNNGYEAGTYRGNPTSDSSALIRVIIDGDMPPALNSQPYLVDNNLHTWRVEVKGNDIALFIDGHKMTETTDNRYLNAGQVGLRDQYGDINVTGFKVIAL